MIDLYLIRIQYDVLNVLSYKNGKREWTGSVAYTFDDLREVVERANLVG